MIVNGNIINNGLQLSRRRRIDHQSLSSNSKGFREWSILVGLILILPMSVTYFHLNQLLHFERCAINIYDNYNSTTSTTSTTSSSLDGIYCKGPYQHQQQQQQEYYFIPTRKDFGMNSAPPSIVKLVTTIMDGAQQHAAEKLSSPSTAAETTTLPILLYHYDYSLAAATVAVEPEATIISSTSTATGFRKNPNKSSTTATRTKLLPITTYFWLLLNIGLYILYWNNRISPSKVALNEKIIATIGTTRTTTRTTFGDFSRGITGNLAHFDIWHIGMNMMTLLQVGEILETSLGAIPLFLWTCSFLGYTTICVIILHYIKEEITQRLLVVRGGTNNSTTTTTTTTTRPRIKSITTKFPNMVGFSGILFCWSTYMTLSLDKNQQICPIPMLTQVCFQTYELTTNGFKFNWGPIVQLVLLQFLLKNVSFIGHLSGIIIGFLWYWNILPSLELSQPSILFPLIWVFGKYFLLYSSTRNDEMTNMNYRNDDYDYDTERGRGHVLVGQGQVQGISSSSSSNSSGYVLGSSKNNNDNNDHNGNHHHQQQQQQGRISSSSSSFLTLPFIRNCFVLHLILNTWVYTQDQKEDEIVPLLLPLRRVLELYYNNSFIISELLMIILLSLLVRAMTFTQSLVPNVSNNGNNNNNNNNPFKSIGMLGRGYIALCTVTFITDSMTLGGWFATRDCNNEIQDGRRNHHSSSISDSNIVVGISDIVDDGDDGDDDDRIWFHIFGSFLINPCRTFGKILTENRSLSSSSTAAAVDGLAMTTTATTASSSTSRGGTRSSNSISERRARILSSRGGGGGGNKSASTVTKVVEDV
ncbi:hypothetical protein FRACYDRAFT_246146 [Fragilariopsis cylindrus CCMP1102]|uniref:Peptidase S54 rhomboid domain-containing protein n=1 Tax=Fragilariopsis cylindrus CCMP1102 TaxID=635003 RepID=A0A1E7EYY6_9STRA|nr:hypothetical protein FRACYDRAFT_246146 [Fragilariopsis cylindrus CCMP1102]|eukprot:OEU11044.1 hypothetical protein FRACYDRAFT_246146 [Fragilariopsis cylindrus CCMP1102]